MQNRRLQEMATVMYKETNNLSPPYIVDLFELNNNSGYHLRNSDFIIPRFNSVTHGKHSLIVGFHMTSPKCKLKRLSILPRFYFHDALEQLKTNFHTNFRFKRILGFLIEYA